MKRWIGLLVLVGVLGSFSCNDERGKPLVRNGKVSEDSLVVEKLIGQSEQLFLTNESAAMIFDHWLRDAETIALRNDFNHALIRIYTLLGKRFRNRSDYLQALNYHKQALELAVTNKIDALLPECYNQMGVVYRRIDENSLALDMHLKAMNYAEEVKDTFNISVSLNGVGNINLSLGRYQAAIEYFKRSWAISEEKNNVLGQAINTNNIGESYLMAGNVDTALVFFFRSLELNTSINSKVGQCINFNSIGDTYIAKGQADKSLSYLLQALEISREVGDLIYVASSLNRVGKTYLYLKEYKKALDYLNEGFLLSKRIGSRFLAEEAARYIASLYEETGRFKESLEYHKLRAAYKDTIMNEKNLYHVTTLEAIFESEKQKSKIEELHRSNEYAKGKIARQKVLIASVVSGAVLITFILFLISRQSQLNEKYQHIKHKQRLLRSQMNPHFIFNALSAIQVFILENDMERSSRFLSDFAKLMRQVLRNSVHEYISLQEELDTLNYYIDLQRLRFANPFDMDIEVDRDIDVLNVAIPPMLTQPFIENAIEHGLRPIGGTGKIVLRMKLVHDQLHIEVDDNGIGIANHKLHKSGDSKHDSMALKIVKERLDIIKRDTGKTASLRIIDKRETDPFSSGTLVRICIPVIDKSTIKIENDEKN
jgi:tetratricopeptide (TPR) repeat protein